MLEVNKDLEKMIINKVKNERGLSQHAHVNYFQVRGYHFIDIMGKGPLLKLNDDDFCELFKDIINKYYFDYAKDLADLHWMSSKSLEEFSECIKNILCIDSDIIKKEQFEPFIEEVHTIIHNYEVTYGGNRQVIVDLKRYISLFCDYISLMRETNNKSKNEINENTSLVKDYFLGKDVAIRHYEEAINIYEWIDSIKNEINKSDLSKTYITSYVAHTNDMANTYRFSANKNEKPYTHYINGYIACFIDINNLELEVQK